MIKMIKVDKIFPHRDNPRKDLGDLEELADSIKQSGILQNLTVVPWGSNVPEWGEEEQKYTVIIGHRRLAAAKLAGLERVPCAIVKMDKKTQVAIMLLENMQRSDLTVYEQAQGFQMMMDLGETVSNISEKTGFSESTVRRRTKLLELDQKKLKETMASGTTLADYAKLEQIENIELRNEVLEKIGTSDFDWALRRAIEDEKRQKHFDEILQGIKEFATEIDPDDTDNLEYDTAYYGRPSDKLIIPDDIDEVQYFYYVRHDYIYLYKEQDDEVADKDDEIKSIRRQEKRKKLDEATSIAYKTRLDFIKRYSNAKARENIGIAVKHLIIKTVEEYVGRTEYSEIAELMGIKNNEAEWGDISHEADVYPELTLVMVVYNMLDGTHLQYYDYYGEHYKNERLDNVYEFLQELGYEMSEEEKQLQDGTHELFND